MREKEDSRLAGRNIWRLSGDREESNFYQVCAINLPIMGTSPLWKEVHYKSWCSNPSLGLRLAEYFKFATEPIILLKNWIRSILTPQGAVQNNLMRFVRHSLKRGPILSQHTTHSEFSNITSLLGRPGLCAMLHMRTSHERASSLDILSGKTLIASDALFSSLRTFMYVDDLKPQ